MRKVKQSVSTWFHNWATWILNTQVFIFCVSIRHHYRHSNKSAEIRTFDCLLRGSTLRTDSPWFGRCSVSCRSLSGRWLSHGLCSLCVSSPGCPPIQNKLRLSLHSPTLPPHLPPLESAHRSAEPAEGTAGFNIKPSLALSPHCHACWISLMLEDSSQLCFCRIELMLHIPSPLFTTLSPEFTDIN